MPNLMPASERQAVYFILASFVGFMFLLRVCLPLNKLRILLLCSLLVLFAAAFFVPLTVSMFKLPTYMNWDMGKIILAVGLVDVPLFIGLEWAIKILTKKGVFDRMFKTF
jgi:hypothetical protein